MANTDCNTSTDPQVVLPPFTVEALPTLQANVAAAQAAGNAAYALAAGKGGASDAYHAAFTTTMRDLGTPMPCSCNDCRAEGESLQVSGWLMVPVQVR